MIEQTFKRSEGRVLKRIAVEGSEFVTTVEDRAEADLSPGAAWWQSYLRGSPCLGSPVGSQKLRVVDAFCGPGGLSLGVRLAAAGLGRDIEILAAIDTDAKALDVYGANLTPLAVIKASVSTLVDFHVSGQGLEISFAYEPEILSSTLARLCPVDLFIAGPPCEGHSNLNNHTRREDPRNHLLLTTVALGVALNATGILIENVPEVRNDYSRVVQKAEKLLQSAGYTVDAAVVKADELGVPQRRARFFLLGVRGAGQTFSIQAIESALRAPATPISWAIGDLLDREPIEFMDTAAAVNAVNQRRIEYLFERNIYDLPDEQRPECHQQGTSYRAVYGRMQWDRPAHTVTTGFNSPGQGRYIHPLRQRVITPREAARIQTFPDWFTFTPGPGAITRKHVAKCIGDAVPPMLAYAAGVAAIAAIGARKIGRA